MAALHVARLDREAGKRLYDELGRGAYTFRTVPYAHWGAQGEGVTVTWYQSGKLVVQGKGTEVFVARHLGGVPDERPAPQAADAWRLKGPEIGSDESGKGDYFGPLVVVAALVRPEDLETLEQLRVQDSKAVSTGHVQRVEGLLARQVTHATRTLMPEDYNEAWAEEGNLNRLLGRLHAEAIDEVLAASGEAGPRIVVDRFGDPEHVRRNLSPAAKRCPFVMPVRGEAHPAVAAASFLARAAFLRGFEELRNLAGGELYLGASDPRILPLARRLQREGGRAWLGRFAKLHFKTTDRL